MNLKIIVIIYVFALTQNLEATATTVTVKKVKGRQAIIESSIPLEVGQTYELQTESITVDSLYGKKQSRKNSLQLGAELKSVTGNNVQDNRVGVTLRYGWNLESFELGPTLSYQSTDLGAGATSQTLFGGYADFNFQKNQSQAAQVWGLTGNSEFGALQLTTGATTNLMNIDLGGFLTWYLAQTSTALRIQAAYHTQKITTTVTTTNLSGFISKVFLVFYF